MGIAIIIVLVTIAAYVLLNRVSPTAEGDISAIWLYQPLPGQMADGSTPPSNGLIMLVPVQVRNVSSKPLSIMDLSAVVHVGDTDYRSYAAPETDFDKVFQYYPDLEAYRKPILLRHSPIPPGGESQGLVVFNFALTEDQWSHASSFYIDVTFDTLALRPAPHLAHLPGSRNHCRRQSPRSSLKPHPRNRQPSRDRPATPPFRCHPERRSPRRPQSKNLLFPDRHNCGCPVLGAAKGGKQGPRPRRSTP